MRLPESARGGSAVTGVTLRRDAATFTLESGRLCPLAPVGGRVIAAVFNGRGRVSYKPPTRVEQEQQKRVLRSDSLEQYFSTLFLLFADSTAMELGLASPPEAGPAERDVAGIARQGLGYSSNRGKRYFDPHFMLALLNGETVEWFSAVIGGTAGGPLVFRIDPYEVEEVTLSVAKSGESMQDNRAVLVNQAHRLGDYAAGRPPHDWKQRFSIHRYVVDATIGKDLKTFRASTAMELDWVGQEQEWFSFWLDPLMKVDSVTWPGEYAVVARSKDTPVLWVKRPAAAGSGLPPLSVHYHADLFMAAGPWLVMKTSSGWYPSTDVGYGAPMTAYFDLTFHTPRGFSFASVGDKLSIDTTGEVVNSHWRTPNVSAHASFNFGKFETFETTDARNLPVTVLINQEAHDRPGGPMGNRMFTGMRQSNMKETVGQDVALSLNFFRDAFGAPVANRFYATEIYGFHGQAFPGLIHFSFLTYQGFMLAKGEDEAFRAHEMAHQWWGLGVTPQSYRDAWISEGFAEFAGWWYTEAILRDSVALGKIIKKSKDELMLRRRQAGPLALGTRLADGDTPQDYSLIVYQKGAWVLRMLRFLMLDPGAAGEEPFRRMIKDFYESYRGLPASTEDFQDLVSRHFRAPMDWFFNSWFYGTGIPTYEWSHTTAESGGKYTWKLHVTQKGVADDFAMIVPVHFYFRDGGDATLRVLVKGPSTDFSGAIPGRPERVVFNESDAVLAEVKEVDWR